MVKIDDFRIKKVFLHGCMIARMHAAMRACNYAFRRNYESLFAVHFNLP
jgi:hypothetical protein